MVRFLENFDLTPVIRGMLFGDSKDVQRRRAGLMDIEAEIRTGDRVYRCVNNEDGVVLSGPHWTVKGHWTYDGPNPAVEADELEGDYDDLVIDAAIIRMSL